MKKKKMRKTGAFMLAIIMMLSAGIISLAAGTGTAGDPFIGEGSLNDTVFNGSITIHKYNTAAWEKEINENRPEGAEGGFYIKYYGSDAVGTELQSGSQVGYYYLTAQEEADDENRQPVYLSDLEALSHITFRIQSAVPREGREGSTAVGDYTITGNVDSYGKTAEGIMKWTGVPRGYYIITELTNETTEGVVNPFVISVPMTDPADDGLEKPEEIKDIHIYPKNKVKDGPEIEKEIDSNLENGNIVTWKITAGVPADIATSQRYNITDIMSSGLEYAGNLVVKCEDEDGISATLDEGTDYTVTSTPGSGGSTELRIIFTEAGRQKLGTLNAVALYITYDTVVNLSQEEWDDLAENAIDNKIKLEFTNEDGTEYTNEPGPVEVEDFAGIEITKLDGTTRKELEGVVFKLYTRLNAEATDVDPDSILKDGSGTEITLRTDGDGAAYYYGLGEGIYYLVEDSTIGGYKLLEGYKEIEIDEDMVKNNDAYTLEVLNYLDNGITLPETGGMGTLIFTIAGLILIIAAGSVYMISQKRKKGK